MPGSMFAKYYTTLYTVLFFSPYPIYQTSKDHIMHRAGETFVSFVSHLAGFHAQPLKLNLGLKIWGFGTLHFKAGNTGE